MHGMCMKIQFKVLPRTKAFYIFNNLSCIHNCAVRRGLEEIESIKVYTLYEPGIRNFLA